MLVGIFRGQTSLLMKFSDRVKEPKLPQRLDQKKIIPSVTETATHGLANKWNQTHFALAIHSVF